MGYYTKFDLTVIESRSDAFESNRFYEDGMAGKHFGQYDLDFNSSNWDNMKWYSWPDDMKNLSQEYPNVVFRLSGEGEESGDLWVAYFMNGDMQETKANITFEEPDWSKFTEVDLSIKRRAELSAKKLALEIEAQRIQSELDSLN